MATVGVAAAAAAAGGGGCCAASNAFCCAKVRPDAAAGVGVAVAVVVCAICAPVPFTVVGTGVGTGTPPTVSGRGDGGRADTARCKRPHQSDIHRGRVVRKNVLARDVRPVMGTNET